MLSFLRIFSFSTIDLKLKKDRAGVTSQFKLNSFQATDNSNLLLLFHQFWVVHDSAAVLSVEAISLIRSPLPCCHRARLLLSYWSSQSDLMPRSSQLPPSLAASAPDELSQPDGSVRMADALPLYQGAWSLVHQSSDAASV